MWVFEERFAARVGTTPRLSEANPQTQVAGEQCSQQAAWKTPYSSHGIGGKILEWLSSIMGQDYPQIKQYSDKTCEFKRKKLKGSDYFQLTRSKAQAPLKGSWPTPLSTARWWDSSQESFKSPY